jgi:hypothetical protein
MNLREQQIMFNNAFKEAIATGVMKHGQCRLDAVLKQYDCAICQTFQEAKAQNC